MFITDSIQTGLTTAVNGGGVPAFLAPEREGGTVIV
jgi:hypothetical protein